MEVAPALAKQRAVSRVTDECVLEQVPCVVPLIPATLHASLMARLDRLDSTARAVAFGQSCFHVAPHLLHDFEVSGFQVRINPSGKKTFFYYYRVHGARLEQRRYKIGDFPSMSVQDACDSARRLSGQVAGGTDPAEERKRERRKLNTDRFRDVAEHYLATYVSKRRAGRETRRILNATLLPAFRNKSIHSITRSDISALVTKLSRTAPTMANRVLAAVRKFFKWCYSNSYIDQSPVAGISAPSDEVQRDRVLEDGELARVLSAARAIGYPYGTIVELLALTGQRRQEVAAMTWEEIDLELRTWTIPASRTKNEKLHYVHLSPRTLDLLRHVPRASPSLVFSSNGATTFSGFSKAERRFLLMARVTE